MNHGKLVPEKQRVIKVVVEKTVVYNKVVTVKLNPDEDFDSADVKAIGAAQASDDGFMKMSERFCADQCIDITGEQPDPEVIDL